MPVLSPISSHFINPRDPAHVVAYYALREALLRAPWGQRENDPDSAEERDADHVALADASGTLLACGRLMRREPGRVQIRSMAVAPNCQGQGLGRRVLDRLEALARGRGAEHIDVHARDSALGFYEAAGYTITRPGEQLFGQIPHHWMHKAIDCADFSSFGLRLRPACDADGPAVEALVFRVLGEYGLAPETDGIDRDMRALERYYEGGFFDLLEDAQGRLVGTVAVRRLDATSGELRRMYLDSSQRGRGLGRACLGHALAWSRRAGIRHLELETASVLREALALYRWAGFRPVCGQREARRCDQSLALTDF